MDWTSARGLYSNSLQLVAHVDCTATAAYDHLILPSQRRVGQTSRPQLIFFLQYCHYYAQLTSYVCASLGIKGICVCVCVCVMCLNICRSLRE